MILREVLKVLHVLCTTINKCIYCLSRSKKGILPPISDEILFLNASTLTNKIKKGELLCEDVIKIYIKRINQVNHHINAIIADCFDEALKQAREIDDLLRNIRENPLLPSSILDKPLLGVPITCKNSISLKGLPLNAGIYSKKNEIAKEDSSVVKYLKDAGVIFLGLTNTPEFLIFWNSNNKVYGRTNNPYDLARNPGGSSGGEAASISSCCSLVGIGSDIAGSLRIPTLLCGVWGHYPTPGVINIDGMYPIPTEAWKSLLSYGPICRYASDLPLMLKIMAKDKVDKFKLDQPVDFSKLTIFYIDNDGNNALTTSVSPEIKKAMDNAVNHFKIKYNTKVERIEYKKLRKVFLIWHYLLNSKPGYTLCEELALRQGSINPFFELLKYFIGLSHHTFPILIMALLEKISPSSERLIKKQDVDELRDYFKQLLKDDGVLFYPTLPTAAKKHLQCLLSAFDCSYTMLANSLGFPATNCPMGINKDGLPIGFQILSSPYNDHMGLSFAIELEKEFGGWVPPC